MLLKLQQNKQHYFYLHTQYFKFMVLMLIKILTQYWLKFFVFQWITFFLSFFHKIGISWISKRERYGKDKSINLNLLKPILKLQKYSFINLQYGDTKDELQDFEKNERIKIHAIQDIDLFNDFESIASLLKNLDLLISVSNSTAHVAAALGVPTWIIKPKNHATFHYWNQPKNTTPWYPSVKLYSYFDGWKKTIEMVKNDLEKKFI